MKKMVLNAKTYLMLLMFTVMNTVIAMAQDEGGVAVNKSTTQTTTTTTTQDWYTQPWVWIVGGLVFILLLIALVRGGSGSRTDVHRTTIRRDVSTD